MSSEKIREIVKIFLHNHSSVEILYSFVEKKSLWKTYIELIGNWELVQNCLIDRKIIDFIDYCDHSQTILENQLTVLGGVDSKSLAKFLHAIYMPHLERIEEYLEDKKKEDQSDFDLGICAGNG